VVCADGLLDVSVSKSKARPSSRRRPSRSVSPSVCLSVCLSQLVFLCLFRLSNSSCHTVGVTVNVIRLCPPTVCAVSSKHFCFEIRPRVFHALEIFQSLCCINLRFTYLLIYLLTYAPNMELYHYISVHQPSAEISSGLDSNPACSYT